MSDAPHLMRYDTPGSRDPAGFAGETTEVQGRWWKSYGQADLGVGLGSLSYGMRPDVGASRAASQVVAAGTVVSMGVRWRTTERSVVYADASNLRAGPGIDQSDAVVGKVGLELSGAQSRFGLSYGGLGLRLSGDTRMSLRLKRGGIGISMRSTF